MIRIGCAVAALLACAGLAGGPSAARAAKGPAPSREEVAKYSAYVEAINDVPDWGRTLEQYVQRMQPDVVQGRLRNLGIEDDVEIDRAARQLDTVLAMPSTLGDVDPLARKLSAALKALAPVSHDLQAYGASKGFLVDKGQKARELDPPYVAALHAVADAQERLAEVLDTRDFKLAGEVFAAAPKGSPLFYAAGMTYYGKQSVVDERRLSKAPLDPAALAAFQKSLEQFADMVTHWNREMRKDKPEGCVGRMVFIDQFVSQGREIVAKLQDGSYVKRAKKVGEPMDSGGRGGFTDDARMFVTLYHSVVIVENQQMC